MGTQNRIRGRLQIRSRPVKHGVLFVRFFGVVIITILITALFTTLLYTYISRTIFTSIKENDMLPKARAVGRLITVQRQGRTDLQVLFDFLDVNKEEGSVLDAYLIVADERGKIQFATYGLLEQDVNLLGLMQSAIEAVLLGNEIRTEQFTALKGSNLVVVGTPVWEDRTVKGAVLMMVPLVETMVAMGSLNGALILSLLISLPIVAILVYYAIGLIVKPLRQMRDVALKMADGNFTARADDTQRGEIGQLGRSLNFLSRALSKSVSDLTLERNKLQQIVDGLSEGIVAVDRILRVTHSNPALKKLFSSVQIQSGDEKLALIPYPEVWADFERVVQRGERIVRQLALPDRVLQMSITPLSDPNESIVPGAVGLFRDITESERLERTRRDYVANVSHEMRTPLTAMRGLIEPLTDGMVRSEETRNRYYSILMRETMRLSRLIDDLMELSRLQSGALAFDVEVMSLQEVIRDIENKYAAIAEEHGLNFTLSDILEECPPVLSNPDRIEEILVILLDNAMKYTPEGGSVAIEAGWNDERVTLWVRDTGIGIAPEDQPYVFDRFYKVDRAHSGLGSGLGLSIASELLKWMGEEMWLESEPGKGSAFFFTIKRA